MTKPTTEKCPKCGKEMKLVTIGSSKAGNHFGYEHTCHSPQPTESSDWEERFDNHIEDMTHAFLMEFKGNKSYEYCKEKAIKSFIESLITKEREILIGECERIINWESLKDNEPVRRKALQDAVDLLRSLIK